MKNLDWFPARDLALQQRNAIRRPAWRKWLLYRYHCWIISETDLAGNEQRRVVQASDWTDNEALAHDWTNEPWEGGTTPPCCEGPALTLAANATGGLGSFTLAPTDPCAGAGDGGGVPPADGGGSPVASDEYPMRFAVYVLNKTTPLSTIDDASLLPLMPDGGSCWITTPAQAYIAIECGRYDAAGVERRKWSAHGSELLATFVWIGLRNEDLSVQGSTEYYFGGSLGAVRDRGAEAPYNIPQRAGSFFLYDGQHWMAGWREFPGLFSSDVFSAMPGQTISICVQEVDELNPTDHRESYFSYTFAPWCMASGHPVGGP